MKRIGAIAANDFRLFMRLKSGYIWMFAMPFLFIFFFGSRGQPSDEPLQIWVDQADQAFLGERLVQEIARQDVEILDARTDDVAFSIHIPENFTTQILARQEVDVQLTPLKEDVDTLPLIQAKLERALLHVSERLIAAQAQGEVGETTLAAPPAPTAVVQVAQEQSLAYNGYTQALMGYMVMFLLMNLIAFGGYSISSERRTNVLNRLTTHSLSNLQLVTGKILGRVWLAAIQIAFYLYLARRYEVGLEGDAWTLASVLLLFSWAASAMGVLIGCMVKQPEKVGSLSLLLGIVMAMLGGCWFPADIMPATMQAIGSVLPTTWAMNALQQVMILGADWTQIWPNLVWLALFCLATTGLAAKKLAA